MFDAAKKNVADWYGVQRLRFRYYISSFLIGSGVVYCIVGAILLLSSPIYSYWLLIPAAISIGIGLALWKYRTEGARKALICWVVFFCLALVVLLVCLISEGRRASEYFQVLGSFFALAGPAFVAVTHGSVLFGKGAPTHAEVRGHYLNKDLSALTVYRPDPATEPKGENKFITTLIGLGGILFGFVIIVGLIVLVIAFIGGIVGRFSPSERTNQDPSVDQRVEQAKEEKARSERWKKIDKVSADVIEFGLKTAELLLEGNSGSETVIPAKLVIPE